MASLCGCIGLCACCFSYSSETPDIKDDWFKCWLHICPWPLVNHNPNRQRTINTYNNNNNNNAATPTTNTGGFDAVVTSGGGGGGDAGAASIRLRGAALEMQILADAERCVADVLRAHVLCASDVCVCVCVCVCACVMLSRPFTK